jgi:hypothetical protein
VSRQSVWLVDVDGTLALPGNRNPYDWASAGDDLPNPAVVAAVQALATHPSVGAILLISGREEKARDLTERWLNQFEIPYQHLFMRASGDYRADDVVKEEIYRSYIQPRYSVTAVFDDRDRVVKMWRRIGLVCLQVADGDF